MIERRSVEFRADDETMLCGWLFLPEGATETPIRRSLYERTSSLPVSAIPSKHRRRDCAGRNPSSRRMRRPLEGDGVGVDL